MIASKSIVSFPRRGSVVEAVVLTVDLVEKSAVVYELLTVGLFGSGFEPTVLVGLRNLVEVTVDLRYPVTILLSKCTLLVSYFVVPLYYLTTSSFIFPIDGLHFCRVVAAFTDSGGLFVSEFGSRQTVMRALFSHPWVEGGRSSDPPQLALEVHVFIMGVIWTMHKALKSKAVNGQNSVVASVSGVSFAMAARLWEHSVQSPFCRETFGHAKSSIKGEHVESAVSGSNVICVQRGKPFWSLTLTDPRQLGELGKTKYDWIPKDVSHTGQEYTHVKALTLPGEHSRVEVVYSPLECTLTIKASVETRAKDALVGPTAAVIHASAIRDVGPPPHTPGAAAAFLSGTYYVQLVGDGRVVTDVVVVLRSKEVWESSPNKKTANSSRLVLQVLQGATAVDILVIWRACMDSSLADQLANTTWLTTEQFLARYQLPAHPLDGVVNVVAHMEHRRFLVDPLYTPPTIGVRPVTLWLIKALEGNQVVSRWSDAVTRDISNFNYRAEELGAAATHLCLSKPVPPTTMSFVDRLVLTLNTVYPGLLLPAVEPATKRTRVVNEFL